MVTSITAQPAHEVNTTTAGDQAGAAVAVLAGGGHVVAFNSSGNVLAQFFDASGAKTGGEVLLFTGCSLGGIAALPDGSLVASASRSWVDPNSGPRSSLYFERLNAGGTVVGSPTLVDDTGNYDVWVSGSGVYAMPGGGFGIADLHLSRPTPLQSVDTSIKVYDASGHATGATIPGVDNFLQGTSQMQNGGFVVAGNTNFGPTPVTSYMWRTVDAQGNAIASGSFSGQYGVNDYYAGGVATLADGRSIVTWQFVTYGDKGIGTPAWNAQWIDASGHAIGSPFALGWDVPYGAKFTAMSDGGFLATWEQQSNMTSQRDLYAQHFDASGHVDSGIVQLASFDSQASAGWGVTATPGGFLLETTRTGDGLDLWEQQFDLSSGAAGGVAPAISVNGGIAPVGHGDFNVVGSAALDQVSLPGPHTAWTVSVNGSTAVVSGADGTDVLTNVERVRFGDGYAIAFDIGGDAGQAYRLYQAAFDRAPDLAGLGFQMNDLDMGYPLAHVAQNFIDGPEFQRTYGPGLSNTDFITLLYRNVLNREPEAAGLQYHLDEFAHGDTRADMLTHFSESPENQANVIGQIGNGMLFIPYA